MEVVAVAKGYYGGAIREPGDKFVLSDKGDFSRRWMEWASKKAPEPEEVPSVALEDSYHTSHKGGGYWDVFAPGGKIVSGGDSLRKAEAEALVVELTNETAEE